MAEPRVGDRVADRYVLKRLIGRGGFGAVFAALDERLDRLVALKFLRPDRVSRHSSREARALGRLDHPAIVRVHDVLFEFGAPVAVMELVTGHTLADRLASGPFPWRDAARIGARVASALEHAHQSGILHRDIKPSNVLLTADGHPKVSDFGTARHMDLTPSTQSDRFVGTLTHAAPEALGGRVDHRGDVYSLGVLLFEMLTARLPFLAESIEELIQAVASVPASAPSSLGVSLPPALDALVLHCLAKRPADRPRSAGDVEVALLAVLGAEQATTRPTDVPAHLDAGEIRPPEPGERKRVVVVRVELRHADDVDDEASPERAATLRQHALGEILRIVEARGGLVDDAGHGFVDLVFGLPTVRETDAERAVSCAEQILATIHGKRVEGFALRLACAVHSGHALAAGSSDRYKLRAASERALARLMELVPDGRVLASEPVVSACRGRRGFARTGTITTGERVPATTLPVHLLDRRSMGARSHVALVGRAHELALACSLVERALAVGTLAHPGGGVVLTLEGPPGIGKTRFIEEIVTRTGALSSHPHVVLVEAREEATAALQVLRDLLGELSADIDVVDELPAHDRAVLRSLQSGSWDATEVRDIPAAERAGVLVASLARLIDAAAREGPLLIGVEDLHWADAASLQALTALLDDSPPQGVAWILTHRPETELAWHGRAHHRPIVIGPLGTEDERELVREFLRAATLPPSVEALLAERSEGNPLHALELMRSLSESGLIRRLEDGVELVATPDEVAVPATVEAIIAARIDRLDGTARRVLQVASVIDRTFPAALLERALGEDPEVVRSALGELSHRDLIRLTRSFPESIHAFSHALVRDVAYDGILRGRRRVLHGRVAAALEELNADDPARVAEGLARHHVRSEHPALAVPHLRRAAEMQETAGSLPGAHERLEEALRIAARDAEVPLGERVEVRGELAMLLARIGSGERALPVAAAAIEEAEAAQDRRSLAVAHFHAGQAAHLSGDSPRAAQELDAALALASELGDDGLATRALVASIPVLMALGRSGEAEQACTRLEGMPSLDLDARLDLLRARAMIRYNRADHEGSLADIRLGLDLAEKAHRRLRSLQFVAQFCSPAIATGRHAEAALMAERGLAEARRLGAAPYIVHCLSLLAHLRSHEGNLSAAEAAAQEAVELGEGGHGSVRHAVALRTLAFIRGERGLHVLAREGMIEAERLARESGAEQPHLGCVLGLVLVNSALGRLDEALAGVDGVLATARSQSDRVREPEALQLRCEILRLLDRPGDAMEGLTRLEELAAADAGSDSPRLWLEIAELHLAAGRLGDALATVEGRLATLDRSASSLARAEALLTRSRIACALGRREMALADAAAAEELARLSGSPEIEWRAAWAAARARGEAGEHDARRARAILERLATQFSPVDREIYLQRSDRRAVLEVTEHAADPPRGREAGGLGAQGASE